MRDAVWLALALAGSVAPRAVAEEPGGGGGLLTVEGGLVIWTLVVFGLLLYILKRSAWPVLLQAVREREQRLERQLAEAAQAREEAARLLEQQKQALERARGEAQESVTKAKAAAVEERAPLLAKVGGGGGGGRRWRATDGCSTRWPARFRRTSASPSCWNRPGSRRPPSHGCSSRRCATPPRRRSSASCRRSCGAAGRH